MPIELSNITKRYTKDTFILDHVDLTIEDNSFTAVIGRSGSGKSTLLNLVSGLDRPDSGDIKINDKSIIGMKDKELSKLRNHNIGFIFQFFYLQPFLSVLENIESAAFPNHHLGAHARTTRAKNLLESVGLANKIQAHPKTLSGGEIQRVAIARALMNSPSIILADEPTGNLDSETSETIINLLQTIQQQTTCTLIIVTHDQSISNHADRIIKIDGGKITNAYS